MKCSVFIATSVDGFIADEHGGVDWLHSAGDATVDMSANSDMGFNDFIQSVDCMIMGRKCMDVIAAMNLTDDQWPYGEIPIVVLSRSLKQPPESLKDRVSIFSGNIESLLEDLESKGCTHAYIDGGATITQFLNHQLINEMIITQAPLLLGKGIPLFGLLDKPIRLEQASSEAFNNNFVQTRYRVKYA